MLNYGIQDIKPVVKCKKGKKGGHLGTFEDIWGHSREFSTLLDFLETFDPFIYSFGVGHGPSIRRAHDRKIEIFLPSSECFFIASHVRSNVLPAIKPGIQHFTGSHLCPPFFHQLSSSPKFLSGLRSRSPPPVLSPFLPRIAWPPLGSKPSHSRSPTCTPYTHDT